MYNETNEYGSKIYTLANISQRFGVSIPRIYQWLKDVKLKELQNET